MGKNNTYALMFCAIGVALNIILGTTVQMLKIPLVFLDTMGTMLAAVVAGPLWGALAGLATNVLLIFTTGNLTNLPFALVNVMVGLVTGFIALRWQFGTAQSIITGLILAVACPLVGTPIAVWLFGGLTGSPMDFFVGWLLKSGQSIFTAAFIPRIGENLLDKLLSCIIVSIAFKKLQGLPAVNSLKAGVPQ